MRRMIRLRLPGLLALVLALTLAAGCGGEDEDAQSDTASEPSDSAAAAGDFKGETLKVAAFAGGYSETMESVVVPKFEEDTGATVEVVGTAGDEIEQILAAPPDRPPFDVSIGSSASVIQGTAEDLFLPIDREVVTRLSDLTDFHAEEQAYDEVDVTYAVPMDYGFFVMLFNKEALDFEPTSFNDLFRPEVQGRIGLEAINYEWWLPQAALVSDFAPGVDEMYTAEGQDELIEMMAELDVAVWASTLAENTAALERGDIDITFAAVESAQPVVASDPDKFAFSIPTEGAAGFFDYFSIVRGTDQEALAQLFLNHLLDPEIQAEFVEKIPYWMSNAKVEYDGPVAKTVLPQTEEGRNALAVPLDWQYIVDNTAMFDERLKREVFRE